MRVGPYLVLMIILLACTRGQVEMSESRESRSFGLDIDWNEIYVSNFEPTSYFTNQHRYKVLQHIREIAGRLKIAHIDLIPVYIKTKRSAFSGLTHLKLSPGTGE